MASAYAQAGRAREAVAELDALLRARPDSPALEVALAWLLATADDAQVRDGARALQLAEDADRRTNHDDPDVLNALAAAYAETGRFSEAVDTAERALAAARADRSDGTPRYTAGTACPVSGRATGARGMRDDG